MKNHRATTWSKDQLRNIAEVDDLHISPFRYDGVTYGNPTWDHLVSSAALMTLIYRSMQS